MKRHAPDPDPLARWAERTLRQLPDRPAPGTLAPRVLAELHRRASLPWYRRPWLQWSLLQRGSSLVLLGVALYGCFGLLVPYLRELVMGYTYFPHAVRVVDGAQILWNALGRLAQAVSLSFGEVPPWAWSAVITVAGLAWLTSLALGTACWRIARLSR